VIIPDLNVIMYAHIDGYTQHERTRAWWEDLLSGKDEVGIVSPVALGFVRLVTGRRAVVAPLTVEQATEVVRSWLEQPNVRFLPDTEATLARTLQLLCEVGAAGNLTTDAQIAAHALIRRAIVATNDADFTRFPEVQTINPTH
jgi:toxin-antitoxin system PIN domain toxin